MRLIKDKPNIDFLSRTRRNIAVGISIMLPWSCPLLRWRHADSISASISPAVSCSRPAIPARPTSTSVRRLLSEAGFDEVRVQRFGPETDVQVRLPPQPGSEPTRFATRCRGYSATDEPQVELRRVEFVSAQVAGN